MAQRDAKCANASDVSEVETVVPTSKFFQLDVNLDTLKDHLRDIRGHITSQYDHLRKLDRLVEKRATEKALGLYLKRVANSVPQTVGERPHSFKLDEPGFLQEEFDTEDGHLLKEGVEKLIEKMEIISAVCIKNRKFKTKAEERLEALEKAQLKNVQKDQYYRDLEQMEGRIVQHVRESLEKQNQKLEQHKKDLDTAKQDFEQKVHDYRGQVLWRIKDCEELLKERVTKQEIRDQNKSIEVRINQRIDHEIE